MLPGVYSRNADGTFGKFNGRILKNHSYGWYAPFLLRDNPSAQADRKWISLLGLNPEAVNLTGDLLPAVCEVAGRSPGAPFAGSVPGVRRRRRPPGLGTAGASLHGK